jgi:hypothetical protein
LNKIIDTYKLTSLKDICEKFIDEYIEISKSNTRFITWNVELCFSQYHLVRFNYKDGLQTFNGSTRSYRGEGVLYDEITNKFTLYRPTLPVFPEMLSVHKDPLSLGYLNDIWSEIPGLINIDPKQIQQKNYMTKLSIKYI